MYRCLKSRAQIARDEPGLQLNLLRPSFRIHQVPSRSIVEDVVSAGDRGEPRQVGWTFRTSITVEKRATDDEHALRSTESLRDQPGDVLDLGLRPNGDIKPFLNHIDGAIRGFDEH